MKTVGRLLCSSAALAAACLFNTAFATAPHVKVSSNVALIPTAPGVTVDRLPKRKVHISWRRALHAAKREWGLETRQVEVVVRAVMSDEHIDVAGWAVVADLTTHNPAPGNTTVYNEMVIAVSGKSGKVVFSYPADPVVPTAAPAALPRMTLVPPPSPGVFVPASPPTAPTATPPATPTVGPPPAWTGPGPAPTPTPTFAPAASVLSSAEPGIVWLPWMEDN